MWHYKLVEFVCTHYKCTALPCTCRLQKRMIMRLHKDILIRRHGNRARGSYIRTLPFLDSVSIIFVMVVAMMPESLLGRALVQFDVRTHPT